MNKEEQFIRTFLLPSKQQKICDLIADPLRRHSHLGKALHSYDFVPEYCVEIPDTEQTTAGILQMLYDNGAGPTCYIISESEKYDRQECDLAATLEKIIGKGIATLIICEPTALGYYEGNDMEERMILLK